MNQPSIQSSFLEEFQIPIKMPRNMHFSSGNPSIVTILPIPSPNILSDFMDPTHHLNHQKSPNYFQSRIRFLLEFFSGFRPKNFRQFITENSTSSMIQTLCLIQSLDINMYREFDIKSFTSLFNSLGSVESKSVLTNTLISKAAFKNSDPAYQSLLHMLTRLHDIPIPLFIPHHLIPKLQPEFSSALYSTLDPPELTTSSNLHPISPDLISQWNNPPDSSLLKEIPGNPFKVDFVLTNNNTIKLQILSKPKPKAPTLPSDTKGLSDTDGSDSLDQPLIPLSDVSPSFAYHKTKGQRSQEPDPNQTTRPLAIHQPTVLEKYSESTFTIGNIQIPYANLDENEFLRDVEDILTEAKETTLQFIETILAEETPEQITETPNKAETPETWNLDEMDESAQPSEFTLDVIDAAPLFSDSDSDSDSEDSASNTDESDNDEHDPSLEQEVTSIQLSTTVESDSQSKIQTKTAAEESPFDLDNLNYGFSPSSKIQQLLASLTKPPVASHEPSISGKNEVLATDDGEKVQWAISERIKDVDAAFADHVPKPAFVHPFKLDDFQKEAIIHVEQGHCVFVAAHTSAGKTVVAEYAIAHCKSQLSRAIYTSPIKALSNQKFRDFRKSFDDDVGIITGDITVDEDSSCLIMTTEILRSMLYRGADLLRDVEWVIFDEVHYLNDPERGVVWEEVLILLPPHINVILLSATVPNVFQLAEWIGRTRKQKIYLISTLKRPVPLEYYLYVPSKHGAVLWNPDSGLDEYTDDTIEFQLNQQQQLRHQIDQKSKNGKKTSPEIRKLNRELKRLKEQTELYRSNRVAELSALALSEKGSSTNSSSKQKKNNPLYLETELFKICDSEGHFSLEAYNSAKRASEADKSKNHVSIPPRNKKSESKSLKSLTGFDTTSSSSKFSSGRNQGFLTTITSSSLNPFTPPSSDAVDPTTKDLRSKRGEKSIFKKQNHKQKQQLIKQRQRLSLTDDSGLSSPGSGSSPSWNGQNRTSSTKSKKRLRSKTTRPAAPGDPSSDSNTNAWLGVVRMCQKNSLLPIVVFSYSRSKCEECAAKLYGIDLLTHTEKSKIHVHLRRVLSRLKGTDKELPQIKTVTGLLLRGIGIHHSGIMPIVKELVEMCFAASICKVLFATETFALGVNMPARSVFFNGIKKFDGQTYRFINTAEFTQTTGRAGRRGRDVVGTVMIGCWNHIIPDLGVIKQMMLGRPERLQSRFRLTYYMMLNVFRNNELSISDVIKSSFSEFSRQRLLIPSHVLEKARIELEKMRPKWETHCTGVEEYYKLEKQSKNKFNQFRLALFSNPKIIKKMVPGQVVTLIPQADMTYALFPLPSSTLSNPNLDSLVTISKNAPQDLISFSNDKHLNAIIINPDIGQWLFDQTDKIYSSKKKSFNLISIEQDSSDTPENDTLDPSLHIANLAVQELDSATRNLQSQLSTPSATILNQPVAILNYTLYVVFSYKTVLYIASVSLSQVYSFSAHPSSLDSSNLSSLFNSSRSIQNRERLALTSSTIQETLVASVFDTISEQSISSSVDVDLAGPEYRPKSPDESHPAQLTVDLNIETPLAPTEGPVEPEMHPLVPGFQLPEIPEEYPSYTPSKRPTGLGMVTHVDYVYPLVEYCYSASRILPDTPEIADPFTLNITDHAIVENWNEINILKATLNSLPCATCPILEQHIQAISQYDSIKQNVELLSFAASDNALALKPEYEARVQVLSELGFIDNLRIIQLKGRLACEISSCEVLIATEMILENVFEDLNPVECVALLSCLVFQDRKSQVIPPDGIPNNLALACHKTREIALKVANIQMNAGLLESPSKYVQEKINMGLVEVVYNWALGQEFLDILALTDVPEGIIIRIISRLNEICRQFCAAARSIGNSKVFENFEEASILIKRDVVFCVSLYI